MKNRRLKGTIAILVALALLTGGIIFGNKTNVKADTGNVLHIVTFDQCDLEATTDAYVYAYNLTGASNISSEKCAWAVKCNETKSGEPIYINDGEYLYQLYEYYTNLAKDSLVDENAIAIDSNELTNAENTYDISREKGQTKLINVKVNGNHFDWRTKVTVNGNVVKDYCPIAGKITWNFGTYDGTIVLNSNSLAGWIIAPNATVIVEGCGNYDGDIISRNLTVKNEFHGVDPTCATCQNQNQPMVTPEVQSSPEPEQPTEAEKNVTPGDTMVQPSVTPTQTPDSEQTKPKATQVPSYTMSSPSPEDSSDTKSSTQKPIKKNEEPKVSTDKIKPSNSKNTNQKKQPKTTQEPQEHKDVPELG